MAHEPNCRLLTLEEFAQVLTSSGDEEVIIKGSENKQRIVAWLFELSRSRNAIYNARVALAASDICITTARKTS